MSNTEFLEAKEKIREVQDFPKPGIRYMDITPILRDGRLFPRLVDRIVKQVHDLRIDYVVSPECRGFILGSAVALRLGAGFVPVRRKGRLPFKTIKVSYDSSYAEATKGESVLYMHEDAFPQGSRVLIIDDMLFSASTVRACKQLSETLGGEVVGAAVMVNMGLAEAKKNIEGMTIFSCINF